MFCNEEQARPTRAHDSAIPWAWLVADHLHRSGRRGNRPSIRRVARQVCESRAGVMRPRHAFDADGVCLFCDRRKSEPGR